LLKSKLISAVIYSTYWLLHAVYVKWAQEGGCMKPKNIARKNPKQRISKTLKDTAISETKAIHPVPSSPVVGVGASAGGLEAFEQFFANMPLDIGMAFILVPHLDPGHASMMTELLRRVTKLEVNEAVDGTKVKPNCIYVIPPNKEISITHGRLSLEPLKRVLGVRLPIDSFFRSLADDRGEMAIGVILSGTGTDGTLGIRAIHGAGGTVMVQTPSSAKYAGMPESAVQTGLVDYILPPEKMALQLKDFSKTLGKKAKAPVPREDKLRQVLSLIRSRTGHDLSLYKKSTLTRRIEKRMNLQRINTITAYTDYLRQRPEEIMALFRNMLIGVTQFFRDPEAFEALKKILLKYLKEEPQDSTFRAWIPACGTGEEAYSIAILIMECLDELKRDLKVQIFATDLDAEAINYARNGIYPDNIATDVSLARLRRYFTKEENALRVKKEIRELIVFAAQDITKDPPFTKLDVLSCRNLLIYLEADLQNRLVPLFHYSLKAGGLLFLGTSETIGKYADLFEVHDRKWKVFHAKKVLIPVRDEAWRVLPWVGPASKEETIRGLPKTREIDISSAAEKMLLETFAPPSVIANDKGEILYIHGQTGKYLEPAPGRPNWNIFEMARKGLQFEIRSGVHYALTREKERQYRGLEVKTDQERYLVNLTVKPFTPGKETKGLVTILFEDAVEREKRKSDRKAPRKPEVHRDERLHETERELAYTRESLQATVEELQSSNEELKSANEEMQSTNEELQSTNEELETSREELQSMNEELTTVNSELQGKIDQLFRTEDDMRILLENIRIGIIFLDNRLCIKRFTSNATKLYNLIASDVGRPLLDIRSNLEHDDIEKDVKEVLKSLQKKERELQTKDGGWYFMQAVPYRSSENTIEGVVVTFTDLTELKRSTETITQLKIESAAGEFARNIVETVRDPLVALDGELRVISANGSFYTTFQVSKEETEKRLIYELGDGQWDVPELRRLLSEILPQNNKIDGYPVEHVFPGIGRKRVLLNARRMVETAGVRGPMILLAIEDVTQKESQRAKQPV
jgi:two-component system CheB/CheR fusion protein